MQFYLTHLIHSLLYLLAEIYYQDAVNNLAYDEVDTLTDTITSVSPNLASPKIRKDFPETWLWDTISNNRCCQIYIYVGVCYLF